MTFRGPVAPESNPPITPQYYRPIRFTITAITPGATTIVTATPPDLPELNSEIVSSSFVIGQLVRLMIPQYWGANQISGSQSYVLSFPAANQVELQLNSIGMTPFAAPTVSSNYRTTLPQIFPIGDINSGQINTGRTGNLTYIPGSFIDVS